MISFLRYGCVYNIFGVFFFATLPIMQLIDENRWYHFDDSHVSAVNESDIRTSAAYVLFYKRVKTGPNAGAGETSQGHIGP